jgi:hypothetical protein
VMLRAPSVSRKALRSSEIASIRCSGKATAA